MMNKERMNEKKTASMIWVATVSYPASTMRKAFTAEADARNWCNSHPYADTRMEQVEDTIGITEYNMREYDLTDYETTV